MSRLGCFIPSVALAALVPLAACGTTDRPEPEIRIVEKHVPFAVGCVPASLGPAPVFPDSNDALLAAADGAERYSLMAAGRLLRIARLSELEAVVAGCPTK